MYDANEVVENLWIGSVPETSSDVKPFDVIVNLFGRTFFPEKVNLVWIFEDKPELPDLNTLMAVAKSIYTFRSEGKKVLVHCQAGLNRSGLVVGAALAYDGWPGVQAVKRIQTARKDALHNEKFRAYVEGL